jgi:Protein of unknown function (DUF3604)
VTKIRLGLAVSLIAILVASPPALAGAVKSNPEREAYYGDLHLHTTYSFDAYVLMGTRVDPDTAYRFARGDTVQYLGGPAKRREPLDFLAVTDHAENVGVYNQLDDPNSALSRSELGKLVAKGGNVALDAIIKFQTEGKKPPGPDTKAVSGSTWKRIIRAANKYYRPGAFTTFIAYEWTAMTDGANLHRNVIFRGDKAPAPFTSADSGNPEDLWHYLETIRKEGYEALAIPHNANASNGLMYDWTRLDGRPIDEAYAERRAANEPLSEIAQNKGASETNPVLSPNDEFANFEIYDYMLTLKPRKGKLDGSYMRDAYGRGLVLQSRLGTNPFKYGVAGGSDLHSGLSDSAEGDYAGNPGRANLAGGRPDTEQAKEVLGLLPNKAAVTGASAVITSSGTLTGAWAESNTRESLYDAFRRKETFATSGTRLKFRFFGGWDYDPALLSQQDWVARAYAEGVPMGGDLPARPAQAKAPHFVISAVKDPDSGNLDRVQVVKVWLEKGKQKEKVFDVVWSGARKPDRKTGKLPSVGNTVDLKTGQYSNSIGAVALSTVWIDPEFKKDQLAAYYLRVLEIPTPRWTTLLALQSGLPLPDGAPATIQERGWSSPIWYTPKQGS